MRANWPKRCGSADRRFPQSGAGPPPTSRWMLESQPQTRAGCAARAGPSTTCVVQRARNMHNKLSLDSGRARARALSGRRVRWRMGALKHAISHVRETPRASSLWHVVLRRRSQGNWPGGGLIITCRRSQPPARYLERVLAGVDLSAVITLAPRAGAVAASG
jgi:hypothetical protein